MAAEKLKAPLPELASVMPQQGSMILLDRVLSHSEEEGTRCSIDLGKQQWLKRADDSVPAWTALEYMSQCIAAHEGYRAWAEGRELGLGLFVGARRVQFHRPQLPRQGRLEVQARYLRGRAALGALSYACEIRGGDESGEGETVWIEGTLNVAVLDRGRSTQEYRRP